MTTPEIASAAHHATSVPGDVLQSDHHSHFSPEDIAKAVARHQREHPVQPRANRSRKTTPRH
jgi:hypothetical protein